MSVTVRIPTQLRELSGGAAEVAREGATVVAVLEDLEAAHPGFAERLFDERGELRRFVNVFVADEDIRFLDGVDTASRAGADPEHRPRGRGRLATAVQAGIVTQGSRRRAERGSWGRSGRRRRS